VEEKKRRLTPFMSVAMIAVTQEEEGERPGISMQYSLLMSPRSNLPNQALYQKRINLMYEGAYQNFFVLQEKVRRFIVGPHRRYG
jgi:hypothetical protein